MKLPELKIGVSFVRCDECEYRQDHTLRDNLLVTAGSRVAYMHDAEHIELPHGVDGEQILAVYISQMVDAYLHCDSIDAPFDEFIEQALLQKYGKGD